MLKIFHNLFLLFILAFVAGCASSITQDDLARVDQAAQRAMEAAQRAQSTADSALDAANAAQDCCDATNEKIDRMFEATMQK
ncbi:MAG: alanine-zipper protein [Pseudomonadota bacterium]|nr:alanine-zipper protein [Pseudomonadota bacterium]